LGPHRGDLAPSSFVLESWSGGFLHSPPCGLGSSHLGFSDRDYPRKSLETTWPGSARGGGGISPGLVLWRGTCPCWLLPTNSDPGSTQILARHCGAKSQTVSQLANSGLSKHLWTGSVRTPHHLLTTQTEPWGFLKPLAQNKPVHMELSINISFQLIHILGGYTVGTTVRL
jgi:hypothetical protein